jgi:hypothetical protein
MIAVIVVMTVRRWVGCMARSFDRRTRTALVAMVTVGATVVKLLCQPAELP